MQSTTFNGDGYKLGPRIPAHRETDPAMIVASQVSDLRIPSRIVARADTTTTTAPARISCTSENANLCEKPVNQATLALPISIAVIVPVLGAIVLLIYLHRRNILRQRKEDAADPNRNLDFGLGEGSSDSGNSKRKSPFGREKALDTRHRQMSMDMNLSSPYLLPPALQGSKESLHSLARTLHNNEDPYRPIAQYAGSDVGSIRSFKPGQEGSSVHTSSTAKRESVATKRSVTSHNFPLPPRQNSLPKAPAPTADPFATPTSGSMTPQPSPMPRPKDQYPEAVIPQIETLPYLDEKYEDRDLHIAHVPEIQPPPPVAQQVSRKGLPTNPRPAWGETRVPETAQIDSVHAVSDYSLESPRESTRSPETVGRPVLPEIGLGLPELSFQSSPPRLSPPQVKSLPSSPHPLASSAPAVTLPPSVPEETIAYAETDYQQSYQSQNYPDHDYDDGRGRSMQRRSMDFHDGSQQLGVPEYDNRRLSVGFRPLPPDEMMEFEDPEERANRIRSFYKEYFDDKADPHGHPTLGHPAHGYQGHGPPAHGYQDQGQHGQGQPRYYEDYDHSYTGGEAAYFDPETNAFVMPYAQPVTRRAMTPPPQGSRFRGGPPPRGMHGSVGGMSLPGGRGPPRAGSTTSNMSGRWGPPRPGSAMSSQWGPPRPGSSASNLSNRHGQRPQNRKPKGPPPSSLTTLPNPSKLKDDSFALLGAIDFAPPDGFKDRQAGRSQSPAGERRPYALNVPIHSPLVSSFEEIPSVPSPHMLRKSGTFTGLDFAPPKRFKDADNMSDSGSIRSNRSGISAVNSVAIRNGAGRVSRLPGDTVFTQAVMQETLKPNWGMRG